jgi:hypothetical protein
MDVNLDLDELTTGVSEFLQKSSGKSMQSAWIHDAGSSDENHPFKLLDALEILSESLYNRIQSLNTESVSSFVLKPHQLALADRNGFTKKVKRNAHWILVGFIIGSWFNSKTK